MAKTKVLAKKSPVVSDKKETQVKSSASTSKKRIETDTRKVTGRRVVQTEIRKADEPTLAEVGAVSPARPEKDPLVRAEQGLKAAIEALNLHMNTALGAMTEIVHLRGGQEASAVRAAPLDRASAAFRRLIADVVDHQFAEILPPLVALRNEIAGNCADSNASEGERELRTRVLETLDHVFALAGIECYEARVGESFDSLIHLAVGEAHRSDLANGAIVEQFQPGFRFVNGRIISPAKVSLNRR